MKKPFISILLPVFNSESFLQECLDSITGQSFSDWELIAINDGSTDRSLQILQNYSEKDQRIRVISRENRGLVKTLNEGISLAQGEWIARMDADDICLPDRLQQQIIRLKETDSDLCGGQISRIGIKGKHSWHFPDSCEGIYAWMLFRSAFAHPTVMFRKSLAQAFGYSEDYSHSNQDYDLWTRMAAAGIKMTNCPETVLLYRIHDKQISTAKRDKQADLRVQVCRNYWKNSQFTRDLAFVPALIDERIEPSQTDFEQAIITLKKLEARFTDPQAISAINHHRVWLIYRSVNLGLQTILPGLKKTRMSMFKKFAVAAISAFRAGRLVTACKNSNIIRMLPLEWLF